MDKRTETHKLKCNFSDEELLNLGERLAILQQEADQIEDEKKSSVAHFASQKRRNQHDSYSGGQQV